MNSSQKWYLRTQDETFGPESEEKLVEWAKLGRIQPGQEISDDNVVWRRVEEVPFLDMRFSIDIGDGNPRGPFNRAAAEALLASGRLPPTASMIESRAPFEPESVPAPKPAPESAPAPEAKVVEKEVVKEVKVEVPVEKIVEKIVVDETRVKELEGLLAEERRHTTELQARLDESGKAASEREAALKAEISTLKGEASALKASAEKLEGAVRDAVDRENKYVEQVNHLEDELRRLPQAASEVADIQAAMYGIMTSEAEELEKLAEQEKAEFEAFKKRHQERADRMQERRREILKRSGANIEDMTRRALVDRPEDPRTAQLRQELEELRRLGERKALESEAKIRDLTERLSERQTEDKRTAAGMRDLAQFQQEIQSLREQLQIREKDLVAERQKCESLRQQQAQSQQVLMARLAALESPSIGTVKTLETNQSREAKMVRLPGWMRLKK